MIDEKRQPQAKKERHIKKLVFLILIVAIVTSLITTYVTINILVKNNNGEISRNQNNKAVTIDEDSGIISAVDKVKPAVVSIVVTKDLEKIYNNLGEGGIFDNLFPYTFELPENERGQTEIGGGSGFIVSEDGLIITNRHVVSDGEADYTVVTSDGEEYPAEIIAKDTITDLAVIKIEAKNLTVVEFGDSDALKIGQRAIAIGNSLGEYENSVTAGIISATGRNITASSGLNSENLENVIQTDAAINPGNSGGPLVNIDGQVVGINTAIDASGQLIGFAIPINSVKSIINGVIKDGEIVRPYLGVRYIIVTESLKERNNLNVDYGALLLRGENPNDLAIIPGSPADKAGLEENDIILEVNGEKIDSSNGLAKIIANKQVSAIIDLRVLHDGKEKTVKVTLDKAKN
ncbi:MAG: trypsin-like peptidase domain-containing protein [bacterium]